MMFSAAHAVGEMIGSGATMAAIARHAPPATICHGFNRLLSGRPVFDIGAPVFVVGVIGFLGRQGRERRR